MNFLSVCSGIEAASVAWLPLGWNCAGVAEIEKFPCAVLKHHYPDVTNYGDITRFQEWPRQPVDVIIGGTPCQSFSVAGLRKGLADPRGNLALTFIGIVERFSPTWVVWENVPGVLSSDQGRAFGSFLGGLARIGYGFAYRILDAQYFGLAQRRKRVFVVGHIGGQWQRAAAVLFDTESVRWNPPPRRTPGQGTAPTISARIKGGGGLGTDAECGGAVIPIQEITKRQSGTPMNGVGHGKPGDPMYTLQATAEHGVCVAMRNREGKEGGGKDPLVSDEKSLTISTVNDQTIFTTHSLRGEGLDASEDGTRRGTPLIFDTTQITSDKNYSNPRPGDACHPLAEGAHAPAIAFTQNQSGDVLHGREVFASIGTNQNATGRNTAKVMTRMAVRRLTPRECERLQGFPDDYTKLPDYTADGPRYKALGNSFAVPVIRWIGQRIQLVHNP